MKIAFNPSTVAALTTPPNNKDITFDLRGRNIFARGVKFLGTDTWRDIKINNVSIGSNILDLRNGSNTTLTNTNGIVTINSTWRPVVDNLTSNSTTSSLSANQGRVLKSLIDGKSNSGHTHDDRYLKLTGGTMAGNALITFADSGSWGTDKGPQGARGGLYWTGQSDYAKLYAEETVGDNLDLVIQFGDDNSNGLSIRNKANTQTSYISAGGVITTGTFKGNLDWSYITNKPSSYTPSAHTHAWNSLTHSSTTENQAILTNGKANGWKLYTLNISRWDNAANNAHSHSNKSVLDGITSALVNNWNVAYTFVNTITGTDTDKVINKWDEIVNFLAGITEDNKLNTLLNSKLSVYKLADNTNVGAIKNNGIYYSTSDASSGTLTNSPFNTGFALINMTSLDNGDDLRRSRLAFNAYGEIKVSDDRDLANTAETWYNVLTSKNSGINGSTIKLNGTSITVYSSGTADGRYVKKLGDTMTGVLTIDTTNFGALIIKRNDDANGASIQFRGKSSVYGYIGLNNSTKDKLFLRFSSDTSKIYTILDTSSTYISNGKGVINGTTITQVDNATNSTNSTNARKLVNWYSTRPTSLNAQFGDGSLRIFYATSSTTEGKPAEDSHILHLAWDNNGGWDAQLAVHTRSGKVSTRAQNSGTWQPWKTLAFTTDIPSSLKNPYSLTTFGVTYDGSAAKTVTTSTFISLVSEATATITDGTMLITSYASNNGFADTNAVNVPYKRKAIHLWEYIKAKTDSLYTTKSHNHDERYVRAFGTSKDNIDSDWGLSFKTFDPIPSGTPPELNPNISLLSIGNSFNRRKLLAFIYSNDNIYYRRHVDNGFTNWRRLAFANEIPTSLKNPHALTISLNGTSLGPYDGSAAKNINITPSSIGAATSGHNHDGRYVYNYGGTQMDGASINKNALGMATNSGITGDWWHILQAAWNGEYRWNSLIAFPTLNRNGMYYRSGLDDNTKWGSWVKLLDVNNYSSTLDSRYYTESEVNNLLNTKLNRQNLSYGTWNPRGYNLAADYHYNGGDLSISENGGKMYVSIDGLFYQNEGLYRVLDTSDIGSIHGSLTLYQYLSSTDTNWFPLVWGGSDHKNTSNSTGSLYKSYDKLSWLTSSLTLYATNIQTENIKNLSVGGGIYWNPYVESTTDGSDAASITLVKSGVAGGTTLVLSLMNDTNDTILFKTNGSARLYHNSYPILTTLNTYVSGNKGYINGAEITLVNNSDKVDNRHAISTTPNTGIIYKAAIYTSSSLTSYWIRLASIPSISLNAEFVATIHVLSGHSNPGRSAILLVYLRGNASSFMSKSFKICCNSNYDPNRFRLYYKDSDKTSEIWYQTTGLWDGIITTVISLSSEGSLYEGLTLYSGSITAVQTPSMSTYLSALVSTITDNISGNASTATKLQTPRTIWGQRFDGTGNVDNTLRIRKTTGNYCEGIRIQTADNTWATIILGATGDSGTNANAWSIHRKSDNNFAISRNSSDGTNGLVMTSTGMGLGTTAPTQRLDVRGNTTITGFIAASSAFINTGDSTLKVYSGRITDAKSDGNICLQTSIDGTDGQSHAYPTQYGARCNLVLLPRGGQVYIGTNPDGGNTTYKLYVNSKIFSNGGFVKNGSSDSYVLLGGGGHKALSDFASSSHSHNYAVNENYGGFKKAERLPTSGFYQSYISEQEESGGNAPWTSWMHLINCLHSNTGNNYALLIAASFFDNNIFKIRVTNNNVNNTWRDIIHSGNIGSQTVANAYHLRINSANTWSTWYWSGLSGQPSWLWGSNDGINMYVWNPSNFRVAYASKAGSVAWDSITGKPASFTPSAHTHSWTSITDKLVAGNEFNIVNAGFNAGMWFNYVPINDRSKTATITGYHFGNGATGYTSINASGFIKKGSNSNYVLLGDGGHKLESSLRVAYASNSDMVDGYHATSGRTFNGNINWSPNWNDTWSDGTNKHPWYGFDHRYPNTGAYSTTISDFFGMTIKTSNTLRLDFGTLLLNGTSIYSINVASATKLQTARSIWGHSFNGTADVNGTIYINNNNSSEGAIRLNNNINSNARISAIDSQVIFNTGAAIRFGGTSWDWNVWAGLKYTHSNKTIYLGIADNSIFNANSALSGGSLRFPGISNVYATTFNGSLSGNASTATNADKLDGTHLNGIFTAFGNNAHNITATIGGVTKSFLVNWAADSDKLDGYHENSFLRYRGDTSTDLEATLWSLIGIKLYNNALPDNLTGVYNYGSVISLPGSSSRFEIYASHLSSNGNGLYYRSGWGSDKKTWLKFIDSSNIGSQSVNYANSAGNADKLDGIHANGLLTALSNSNNGISITVGGTTKSVSNISVNYASSAGSATKVIVNLHTTNDTNYPLVWSNLSNTNSVTENQLYKSWSDLYYNPKNKRLTVGGSVVASSFVKRGGTSLQLLRADGGIATFNWSGQSGLPSWLWGGNNLHSYYVYNPSNFRVAYATSSGSADTLDGEHAKDFVRAGHYESADLNKLDTYSFIRSVNSQVSSTSPKGNIGWYNVILLVHRNGDDDGPNYIGLIALGMTSNVNDIFFRCRRTDPWKTIIHSNNYTEFINNYYWANVKISTSSSTTTSPTVSNLTATSSIRMGNIYLLNTNEINSTSGIHLNYQNSGNISLCYGGGKVGIGTTSPTYKLDVNGLMRASGFHHSSMNSDNYILLAGGGYKSFGGDSSHPVFLGYLNLDHGSDGTVSSSFYCLGYSVPFTYTRGGNYCKISIPDTTHQAFYIKAATASVNYSGGGMDTWTGNHRGAGAWWLHCYAPSSNEVRVKGFHLKDTNNDSWWGGNPLWSDRSGVNRITVCIFGYVTFR